MCEISCILDREDLKDLNFSDTVYYKCARLVLYGGDYTVSQDKSALHNN
jgi:hypothetical protein